MQARQNPMRRLLRDRYRVRSRRMGNMSPLRREEKGRLRVVLRGRLRIRRVRGLQRGRTHEVPALRF